MISRLRSQVCCREPDSLPPVPPEVEGIASPGTNKFRNWSSLSEWIPAYELRARHTADVVAAVKAAGKAGVSLRVVGAGKSFSNITSAGEDDWLLDVSAMSKVHKIEETKDGGAKVTVGPALTLRELNELLHDRGYVLPTMTAANFQTIAGLVATNSHGSAPRQGGFSTLVDAIQFVDGTGKVHNASRTENPEYFNAVRSGLGLAGVITNVTLKVEKAFNYDTKQGTEPLDVVLDQARIDRKIAENDFYQFFLFPYTGQALVTEAKRTNRPAENRSTLMQDIAINYGDPMIKAVTSAIPGLVKKSWKLTAKAAPDGTFVDAPHRVISYDTPAYGPDGTDSTEFFFPVEHTAEIIKAVNEVLERGKETGAYKTQFYGMVRFLTGDETYLSYAYSPDRTKMFGGLSIAYNKGECDHGDFFGDLKQAIRGVLDSRGRSEELTVHFGKRKDAFEPGRLQAAYPGLEKFEMVRQELDPKGLLMNRWGRRWLGLDRPGPHLPKE